MLPAVVRRRCASARSLSKFFVPLEFAAQVHFPRGNITGMGASWLRFAVVLVAILAVIWWASTMTIYYTPRYAGRFGEWTPMYTVVAVENPAAPSREEVIWRGALGTF